MAQFIRYNYMGADMYDWNIKEFCGYEPRSTYYTDFGIAERFGEKAVIDTYNRAIKSWGKSIEWMTEIVMVLNWKILEHHMRGNEGWMTFYNDMWELAEKYVQDHFGEDKEAMSYFYRTTD